VKRIKQLFLGVVLSLLISLPTQAAERVASLDSVVVVEPNGRVNVTETIAYDFGYAQRHGIYRYIPVVYDNDKSETFKPGFGFDGASLNGQDVPYKVSSSGNNMSIKIGDPNKYVSGVQVYTIRYHFDSLLVDKGGDLLRFDVAGAGWEVPIDRASVTVQGPVQPKLACYTGLSGSQDQNCAVDAQAAKVSTTGIGNGADLTIDALFPSKTVSTLLQPYVTPWWVWAMLVGAIVYVLAGIGLIVAAAVRWLGIRLAERRAQKGMVVVAQYEPPKDLSPGEIGLLSDNRSDLVEITAILLQAAVKGIISIELMSEKSLLKNAQYTLHKKKDFSTLPAEERPVFKALFGDAKSMELANVNRTAVASAVAAYHSSIQSGLKAKGFYTQKSTFSTTAAVAGLVFLVIALFTPMAFIAAIFIVPIGLFAYRRAGSVPRRTSEGLATWAYVEGFKLFLSVTEKDRLAFTDAPAKTPKQFSAFLPYAVALGVEEEWAKQFEGIDVASATGWYDGHGRSFTAGYIAGSLHNSFVPSVAASSTKPSSSSSGGFGSGSSGGGFGGGGGGSW
jgi:uncharacterized membrane protein YgcG